jgi:hypothetical protein
MKSLAILIGWKRAFSGLEKSGTVLVGWERTIRVDKYKLKVHY